MDAMPRAGSDATSQGDAASGPRDASNDVLDSDLNPSDAPTDAGDASVEEPEPPVGADFAASCREYEDTTRPSCVECNGAALSGACEPVATAFSNECAPAQNCYIRNCLRLCTDGPCPQRCDCAETCIPAGESRCKDPWSVLLDCVSASCKDDC